MDPDSPKDPDPKEAATPVKIPAPLDSQEGDPDWVEVRESWVGEPADPIPVEPYAGVVLPPPPASSNAAHGNKTLENERFQEGSLGDTPKKPRSAPPPLPPSAWPAATLSASAYEAFALAAARAPDTSGHMVERLGAADYDGALRAAECVLRARPTDFEALQTRELARGELRAVYLARLGEMSRVPKLVADGALLRAIDVDFRAGLVLAKVDGAASLDDIVVNGALAELDTLRILSELVLSGIIDF